MSGRKHCHEPVKSHLNRSIHSHVMIAYVLLLYRTNCSIWTQYRKLLSSTSGFLGASWFVRLWFIINKGRELFAGFYYFKEDRNRDGSSKRFNASVSSFSSLFVLVGNNISHPRGFSSMPFPLFWGSCSHFEGCLHLKQLFVFLCLALLNTKPQV